MSQQNIEQYRRWFEAYNARDTERLIEYCDPAIELHSVFAVAGGAIYRGHEGMRKLHQDLRDVWGDEIRLDPERYFELGGERVLVFAVLRGRGGQSGVDVTMTGAHVTRWRDGLLVYAKGYARREDALRDLGVSLDDLEPIDP
jgi:ketosteroid isomerase-like protein